MISDQLFGNQIVSGGLFLMFAGGALATLRKPLAMLVKHICDRVLFTVEIDSNDSAYAWVRAWLSDRSRSRYLSAGTIPPADAVAAIGPPPENPKFYLCPRGVCILRFHGKRFLGWVSKESIHGTTQYRETITLQCWRGNREQIEAILSEAHAFATGRDGPKVSVWVPNGGGWALSDRKSPRPISSIVLRDGIGEMLVGDLRKFLAERQWYLRMGIPWQRGYLLYGPPGNGKSSLAHALASELKMNINAVNLASFYDDSQMLACLSAIPAGHILLLEDIDAAFNGRESKCKVSFAALLNAIDGASAKEGRVLIMTTNHRDALDPALIRQGRADLHVEICNANRRQIRRMFDRFFPDASESEAEAFVERIGGEGVSMAKVQEALLDRERDAAATMHMAA